jgi:hypothetical protein
MRVLTAAALSLEILQIGQLEIGQSKSRDGLAVADGGVELLFCQIDEQVEPQRARRPPRSNPGGASNF